MDAAIAQLVLSSIGDPGVPIDAARCRVEEGAAVDAKQEQLSSE
jgi:hypothetical protein